MVLEALSKTEQKSMFRVLAAGRYQLLLGAGASVGSRDASGAAMPMARELASQISDKFGTMTDEESLIKLMSGLFVDMGKDASIHI